MAARRPMTSKHWDVISFKTFLFLIILTQTMVCFFNNLKRFLRGDHIFHASKHLSRIRIICPRSFKCVDHPLKTLFHTFQFQLIAICKGVNRFDLSIVIMIRD